MIYMLKKEELKKKFSKDWKKYYKIEFLVSQGFVRKICPKCGKGFWTLDPERKFCPDQPCSFYEFLDNPPTKKKFEYLGAWKAIEDFFIKNGHTSLNRYPVVCRWYPLFFTIAGIIDFYRLENGNVVFDFPANPVFVNQPCLRFKDISNVGVTGKHYTCFVMVQQSSIFNGKEGYWKERTIELDFNLLNKVFGIKPEEIVFVEDIWVGPGALGPSLEYFVRGLELGNAVFTEFLYENSKIKEMERKVVDMGAGLERFAWISQGTPTSYDVVFSPVLKVLKKKTGVEYDEEFFFKYSKFAGSLNIDEVKNIEKARKIIAEKLNVTSEELKEKIEPLEALYSICDHTLGLTFAICDGALPSNVGGGYNLRVILRRALSFIEKFNWNIDLVEVCRLHAKNLKPVAPELLESMEEVEKILKIEKKRYEKSKERARRIVEKIIKSGEKINEEKLVKLYESEGITPEVLIKTGLKIKLPSDFYKKITEKHEREGIKKEEVKFDLRDLPKTKILFYDEPEVLQFKAKVLKVFDNNFVVLDQTAFYPTSGGQLHDKGFIDGKEVLNVQKIGEIIIHQLKEGVEENKTVFCKVDEKRREILRKHHTATHIINYSARKVLGRHVWQHGAEKDVDKARLDITHFESLNEEEIKKIENLANEIVERNLPVKIELLPRNEAEKKYGFRIYQGGAVPQKIIRIVSIDDLDHEACGGLHCNSTKDVGFILILKTKRIADGLVRLEFCSGDLAFNYLKEKEKILKEISEKLGVSEEKVPEAVEKLFEEWKKKRKKVRKLRRRK